MDASWVVEVLNAHVWYMCLGFILLRGVNFRNVYTARQRVTLWVMLVLGGVLVFLGIPNAPVVFPFMSNHVMEELIYRGLMTIVLTLVAVDPLHERTASAIRV